MTTLRVCVQKQRSDGYYPVYIRVIHGRQSGFIKTDKMVDRKSVTKTREIRDNMVLKYCTELISEYNAKLNMQDTSQWSVKEIISFLTTDQSDASFSEYAKLHINRMINSGHERNAKNYKLAVASLEQYMGTNKIMFSYLTSVTLKKWIDHLAKKMRAKEMYPVCVRQIFKAALVELNDEERGVIRIKFNPWLKVQIPKSDKAEQRAISAEACREFFNRPLPQTKMISSLPELGRDVAKLVLCLGGINTVDLFYMKKSNYKNGVIGYNRAKTRHSRSDEAYIEMRVEPFIQTVFDKYLADDDDEFLFNFHLRYCDSDSFSANVNNTVSTEEFDTALSEIMNHDRWILDGNYLRTLPMRLEKADTIFIFDLPLDVCLSGAIERLGKERVDMPWKDDVLDEEFCQWITDFPETQLPIINLLLESYNGNVVRFTSRREADEYIERL